MSQDTQKAQAVPTRVWIIYNIVKCKEDVLKATRHSGIWYTEFLNVLDFEKGVFDNSQFTIFTVMLM